MIRRNTSALALRGISSSSAISSSSSSYSRLMMMTGIFASTTTPLSINLQQSTRQFHQSRILFEEAEKSTTKSAKKSSSKKASSKKSAEEKASKSSTEEVTSSEETSTTTSTTTTSSTSTTSASATKAESKESSSSKSSAEKKEQKSDEVEKEIENKNENTNENTNSDSSEVMNREQDAPVVGTVEDYSRVARANENRLNVIEAQIWHEETCYHPILARGKQNVYEHTDDIPKDVKPMFGDTQIWQTREYFEYRRKAESTRFKIMYLGSGLMVLLGVAGAVAFTRIWIDQPNEVATIRRDLLSQSYGRVLELAAGQGINIGIYPYAVTDVVLMDANPQELHILRSRLPRTAYPTYQVVCDKAEELASFPDNCFDTVVDMFGMCHYKDPVKVLKQMQRVCKPTGTILMLEHGKTKYSTVNWFLDWYADSHYEKTNGCQWNKDLMGIFKEAGLVIRNLDTQHYGTTHIVVAHPEVSADAPLLAGGQPAPAIMSS